MEKELKTAYILYLNKEESDAIFWHGYRYFFTDLLSKHLQEVTENTWKAELTEPEAWKLVEAWKDDNYTLACGNPDLINKIQDFMETII